MLTVIRTNSKKCWNQINWKVYSSNKWFAVKALKKDRCWSHSSPWLMLWNRSLQKVFLFSDNSTSPQMCKALIQVYFSLLKVTLLQALNLMLKVTWGEVSGHQRLTCLFPQVYTILSAVISKILKDVMTRNKKPQCSLCLKRLGSCKEQL